MESTDEDTHQIHNSSQTDVDTGEETRRYPQWNRKAREFPGAVRHETFTSTFENPIIHQEALSSSDKEEWSKTVNAELIALKKKQIWELVELPQDKRTIKSRWVFKRKKDMNGRIIEHKARLVAKGCSQRL